MLKEAAEAWKKGEEIRGKSRKKKKDWKEEGEEQQKKEEITRNNGLWKNY